MDFDELHLLPVDHLSQAQRWLAVSSCNLVTSSLVFVLIRHLPKGLPRLLALSPIILLNIALPCVFSAAKRGECIEKGLVFWTVSWLGNFRLLALAWNRGSLMDAAYSSSFLQFLVALYMPMRNRVRETAKTAAFSNETPSTEHSHNEKSQLKTQQQQQPRRPKHPASESSPQLLLRGAFKALLLSLTIRAYALSLPAPAVTLMHSANLFLFVTLLCELVAGVVAAVAPRFAVEPHFRRPYLATSLGSFWARRWNLVVSGSLRETVYEPVLDWLEPPCSTEGEKAAEKRARGKKGNSEFGNGYPAANGGHDTVNGRGCGVSDGFEVVEKINGCSEKVNGYSDRINGCCQRSSRKQEMGCVNGSGENQKGLIDKCGDTCWLDKAKGMKQKGYAAPAAAAGTGTSPSRHIRHMSFSRAAATIASFAVSGIMHELVILYIGGAMTGEQMVFFTLHGVLTVAEAWVRKEWGKRELASIPKVVAGGLALGFLLSTGHVLFFAPYQRLGVISCVVDGLQAQFSQVRKLFSL